MTARLKRLADAYRVNRAGRKRHSAAKLHVGGLEDRLAPATLTFNTSDSQFDPGFDNHGWWADITSASDANPTYIAGHLNDTTYRNFFSFDLRGLDLTNQTITSARLELQRFGPNQGDETETLGLFDVSTDAAVLNENSGINPTIFNDLGSGTSYGTFVVTTAGDPADIVTFPLTTAAQTDIAKAAGKFFSIGGALLSLGSPPGQEYLFGNSFFSNGPASIQRLVVETQPSLPAVAIDNVTKAEGDVGPTDFTFAVSLSRPSTQPVVVEFSTSDGTATVADGDYVPAISGAVTFNPGETSKPVTIVVNGDTRFEPSETFFVNLMVVSGASVADAQGVGTITNDDPRPTITVGDVTSDEGNLGDVTQFRFNVRLTSTSTEVVTVTYNTRDDTALVADGDYAPQGGALTFLPGERTKTVLVDVLGDDKFEGDEVFVVELSAAVNATIGDNGIGTIVNDDPRPTIRITNVSKAEGDTGQLTPFTFTVTLSNPSAETATVAYTTQDGTAEVADGDYVPRSGVVTFVPGDREETITVQVVGDDKFEPAETFHVTLLDPVNAALIAGTSGTGTIVNDDPRPTVTINDVSKAEGDTGLTDFTFVVRLSNPSSETITVAYSTQDGTAKVSDADYLLKTGVVTFLPGDREETITIQVVGDDKFEPNETFFVNLTDPTNADIAVDKGLGTIVNDDAQPRITITDVTKAEGDTGLTAFTFTVRLSNPSSEPITVEYATADGTAKVADADYLAEGGVVTFVPGDREESITIDVVGDDKFEPTETFVVNLSLPVNATIADPQGVGTIVNDDAQPTIRITDVTKAEGDTGTTAFTFTVSLSNPSSEPITVEYATADGTAQAPADYFPNSGALVFLPGDREETITVRVVGDLFFEPDETFFVNLFAAVNAGIADPQGQGTIKNDDSAEAGVILIPDPCDPAKTALVVRGSQGDDTIHVHPTDNHSGVIVNINGSQSGPHYPTGRIIILGQTGNDVIHLAASIRFPNWLFGEAGNDYIRTDHGDNVLAGGDGDDELLAKSGRDLLIGGRGADRLVGNEGDDILIAGTYDYESVSEALCAVMDEWTSSRDYHTRVKNLRNGTGSLDRQNGVFFLNITTVHDDAAADTLTGCSGQDWFFANTDVGVLDCITDRHPGEELDEV